MSEHVAEEAVLAIAALSPDDPERQRAEAHAGECPACRERLEHSRELLRMMEDAHAVPGIDPALALRIKRRVLQKTSPLTRACLVLLPLLSLLLALHDGSWQGLALQIGQHCLLLELAYAASPLAVGLMLARSKLHLVNNAQLALGAMGFSLLGQWYLRNHCEAHDQLLHLLLFHVGGVVLAGALAFAMARALSRRAS